MTEIAVTASTTAKGDILDDILGLSPNRAEDLVDLFDDRIAATTVPGTGSVAGTYEVSMAGGEDGFQDGDPKDPPDSDGESDIVKALKKQGYIKDAPDPDDAPPDFGEMDVEELTTSFAPWTPGHAADGGSGLDSFVELWI